MGLGFFLSRDLLKLPSLVAASKKYFVYTTLWPDRSIIMPVVCHRPARYRLSAFFRLSLILQPASCISFLFVYWILLICNRHINTTPIMPPTNTPQINFNIVTFSFSIFWGFQGFSLTSCRRTDRQETCMAIQRRCLLVLCILLHPSHCSGYQKIYLPDNTFDNFHTAPYSLLLTLSQQ